MNREEAKYYLQSSGFSEEQIDTIEKAFTSTDAISRQAALGCCRNEWEEEVEERLKSLPSVAPQPKTGHWIEHPEIETSTPEYLMFYECSECGDRQCFCKSDIHKKRFCSNCGCRMVEPQERSDKDADKKCTYKETGCGSCKRQLNCPIEADKAERMDT